MGLLARLMTHLDDNLSSTLDRHLEVIQVSKQRTVYECCPCCKDRFAPAACPLVPHHRPCPDCQDAA